MHQEIISALRQKIHEVLVPLISKKCILVDVPYYDNIGDVLIWAGERCFLKDNNIDVQNISSRETFNFPKIDKDTTILFQGGGNLGDLYHEHIELLHKICKTYPQNRILVFPQTVYFENKETEKRDLTLLAQHPDLYFCGRDTHTYELLRSYFQEKAICLPDMAFCIHSDVLEKYCIKESKEVLHIDRIDKESDLSKIKISNSDKSDWPVFMKSVRTTTFINKIFLRTYKYRGRYGNKLWDTYAQKYFFTDMIKEGVSFISPYNTIYSGRLHGAILSILLHKKTNIIDNSYGKNSRFYNTWLKNSEHITLMK